MHPAGTPRTTVVVVTWQGRDHLGACLDALGRQTRPHRALVVDNASTDGTRELLAQHPSTPVVLRTATNLGYAGGLAVALRQVHTPFVAWLNDDAAPEPDWLAELERALDETPTAAAATATLIAPDGSVQSSGVRLTAQGYGFDRNTEPPDGAEAPESVASGHDARRRADTPRSAVEPLAAGSAPSVPVATASVVEASAGTRSSAAGSAAPTGSRPAAELAGTVPVHAAASATAGSGGFDSPGHGGQARRTSTAAASHGTASQVTTQQAAAAENPPGGGPAVFGLCGGAALLRTPVLRAIGGVPARFFCYYEDTDTAWRLRLAGHDVVWAQRARVLHRHGVSTKPGSPRFHRWNERNRLLMLLRCAPGEVAVRELLRFAAITVLLPLRRRRGQVVPSTPNFRVGLRTGVLAEILGRLPATLLDRRRIGRRSRVPRQLVWRRWSGR
ncbi:Glycosyl transferase family 2 [Actinoalloteichus sp. GBA129-24]|uniref:Glycosyl transferase family 2 n=1 Tax=Actinoalloteichus fjordicus TaxID=1612552 RepID=A0AAC9LGD1_9PSEU|nr:Glycosyl transferase family 2 [Actinoalloteichus fjordicus]APU23422.1 Glycosyl transferase family 2 [Actinoalloteichus sp. GBA129-24]